jgi:PAS domain S-box-containing protein
MADIDYDTEPAVARHDGIAVSGDDVAAVEGAAPGSAELIGWFHYQPSEDRWEWSPEVYRIHGYAPGAVTPTTAMVIDHAHPDNVDAVTSMIDDLRRHGRAFSARHRIVDADDQVREVLIVGDQLRDDDGRVNGIHGVYLDVTESARERESLVSEAVADISINRAAIEQAKGMMMVIYGIDADRAFEVLRWRSQQTNTKLRRLAEQISADFVAAAASRPLPDRAEYDRLLLSAHQRVTKG